MGGVGEMLCCGVIPSATTLPQGRGWLGEEEEARDEGDEYRGPQVSSPRHVEGIQPPPQEACEETLLLGQETWDRCSSLDMD